MTEQEKFIFKTLQWYQSLGVTIVMVIVGFAANFMVDISEWKYKHELDQKIHDAYYVRRLYSDSTNCVKINKELSTIKFHINELEKTHPKLEAILPKEEETLIHEIDLQQ